MQTPERHKLSMAVRLANRRYRGRVTINDLAEIMERSGRRCHWCGKENLTGRDLTFEHLEPENRTECIVISCLSCNAQRKQRRLHGESRKAEYRRKWREDNKQLNKCCRAAETANGKYPGRVTAKDLLTVIDRCQGICYWCQKENLQAGDLTFEHLKPTNDPENIVIACVSCNAAHYSHGKPRRSPEERHQAELAQKRKHNAEISDKRAAYRRKYYAAHADAIKAKARKYYAQNKEKLAEAKAAYDHERYLETPAKRKTQVRQWRKANRDKYLAMKRQEYSRRKGKLANHA